MQGDFYIFSLSELICRLVQRVVDFGAVDVIPIRNGSRRARSGLIARRIDIFEFLSTADRLSARTVRTPVDQEIAWQSAEERSVTVFLEK